MAWTDIALTPEPQPLTHRLQDIAGRLWHAYWDRKGRRATVMMLRALDDRALHDIGIDRSEIESVVYGNPGERRSRYDRYCAEA